MKVLNTKHQGLMYDYNDKRKLLKFLLQPKKQDHVMPYLQLQYN